MFKIEMEAENDNPYQLSRFHLGGVHETSIIEWNKKRKLQTDQLDLLRPKHKCWIRNFSSGDFSVFDVNPELEGMRNHMVKGKMDATGCDNRSELESGKDSNSVAEDSDTAMSINEEAKLEADYTKTYLYGRPSTSFGNRVGYNVEVLEDNQFSLEVSMIEKTSPSEEDTYVERENNPSYHEADMQALQNLEEHILALENRTEHLYSEFAKDSMEQSIDKEFEDILFSNKVNTNTYVLSSKRWNVDQEVQSRTRPATIDQEFEQYFSMLML